MAVMTFAEPINSSVQVGDTVYFASTTTSGGFTVTDEAIQIMGVITGLTSKTITVTSVTNTPDTDDFIMFSKDNRVNMSSLLGYYAEVKLSNDATTKAELFSVGSVTSESSK